MFAQAESKHLLEVNFERLPDAASLFKSKAPRMICHLLEAPTSVAAGPQTQFKLLSLPEWHCREF